MCKFNPKNDGRRIDPCMRKLIENLHWFLGKDFGNDPRWKVISCCCGHGKYPMTIVCESPKGRVVEIVSDKPIFREKRFYKKDKQGYYYIPETIKK